jgi:hypothetical protein
LLVITWPLKEVAHELSEGFLKGFRLKYTGPRINHESPNLLSAFQYTEALKDKIQKEGIQSFVHLVFVGATIELLNFPAPYQESRVK